MFSHPFIRFWLINLPRNLRLRQFHRRGSVDVFLRQILLDRFDLLSQVHLSGASQWSDVAKPKKGGKKHEKTLPYPTISYYFPGISYYILLFPRNYTTIIIVAFKDSKWMMGGLESSWFPWSHFYSGPIPHCVHICWIYPSNESLSIHFTILQIILIGVIGISTRE